MREFECTDPKIEVAGQLIEGFLSTLGPYRARGEKVVARNCRVTTLTTGSGVFYSMQGWLESLQEFQQQFGQPFIRRVGTNMYANSILPPELDSVDKTMNTLNLAADLNHRNANGNLGRYNWQPTGNGRGGVLASNTPYPCAFEVGWLTEIGRPFKVAVAVTHLNPETCRHTGGESCSYALEW